MTNVELERMYDLMCDWETIANQCRAKAQGDQFTPEDRLRNRIEHETIERCLPQLLSAVAPDKESFARFQEFNKA